MLDHALHSHLDDLSDILQGFFSGITPGCSPLLFKGRGIGDPTVLVRLYYYSENVRLHLISLPSQKALCLLYLLP
jgi:hypothetical protein